MGGVLMRSPGAGAARVGAAPPDADFAAPTRRAFARAAQTVNARRTNAGKKTEVLIVDQLKV